MNPRFVSASILALLSLTSVTVRGSQVVPVSAEQFRSGSREERIQILSRLATHVTSALTAAELRALLVHALADPDQGIRKRALSVVASRSGGARFSREAEVLKHVKDELPELEHLRSVVLARLSDPDAEVRDAAVMAIGNLDSEGKPVRHVTLRTGTVESLLAAFKVEVNSGVRASIAQGLALSLNSEPVLLSFWPQMMSDPSTAVRQFAAAGARKLPPSMALPLLVSSLSDSASSVRMESAQVIGQFKTAASHLVPVLLDAADKETDPIVKKTLQGTIELLRAQ